MTNPISRWVAGLFPSPISSKDEILEASKPKVRKVYIKQFGQNVLIRKISVRDARKLRDDTPEDDKEKSIDQLADEIELYYARLMAFCVLDKDYQQVFTLEQVMNFDVDVYNELFFAITEINALNLDVEKVKEELKKVQAVSSTTS
jgi:hypothetical protein